MLIQPSLNRSKSSPLFLPFSRAGEAEKAKPLLFYALIQRLMAPIYQYINMLTGFLDKKFIFSPASVNSLSCFIHEPAWHWESSATVKKNRLAKGLCLFLKVFVLISQPLLPFFYFQAAVGLNYGWKLAPGCSCRGQVGHLQGQKGQASGWGSQEEVLPQQTPAQPPSEPHGALIWKIRGI